MASDTLGSRLEAVGTALDLSAPAAGTIQINGVDVTVDLASDSLQDLADRITAAAIPGVTATVGTLTSGSTNTYRLELTGDSGAPTLTDAGGVLQTLGLLTKAPAHELQAARDARLLVDGYAVERSTNHIDDALEGLSLDLLTATAGPVTVTVAGNPEQAVSGLQQLMNSYNGIVRTLNSGLEYDSETKTGGVFFGDQTILGVQSGLYQASLGPVPTLGGAWTLPSQLGLQVDPDGLLSCNMEKLRTALADDPDGVLRLLTSRAETSSDQVEFVSATPDTADSGAAGYAVNLTQAATRATTTSAALAGGIAKTETLTFGGRYSVTLQAGDTLERAAERLNAVFSGNGLGLTASVADDRLQVQSRFWGSHYSVRVKSNLDQGAGGTDLGGATAGTERTVTGQDVAGTIGGLAATGWGQWLTGDAGKAKGLKLKVTATSTGDQGTVKVSKGVASRLASYASQLTATSTGSLTLATDAVSETITDLKTSIADMEEDVQTFIDTMKERFAVAEGILAKNSALQSYLTAQLGALTKSSKSTSA
jgi:flagellar hook-associated protein 2